MNEIFIKRLAFARCSTCFKNAQPTLKLQYGNIVIPFVLNLRPGLQINAQALLPQLGAQKGMIIVNHWDELGGIATELVNAGYGYSVMDDHSPSEDYDLDTYIEVFSDWGWGACDVERKPDWMN